MGVVTVILPLAFDFRIQPAKFLHFSTFLWSTQSSVTNVCFELPSIRHSLRIGVGVTAAISSAATRRNAGIVDRAM
jgi:hypothetical protein